MSRETKSIHAMSSISSAKSAPMYSTKPSLNPKLGGSATRSYSNVPDNFEQLTCICYILSSESEDTDRISYLYAKQWVKLDGIKTCRREDFLGI